MSHYKPQDKTLKYFYLLGYRNIITVTTPEHFAEFDIANILSFTCNRVVVFMSLLLLGG
jgi:hypothetical protein